MDVSYGVALMSPSTDLSVGIFPGIFPRRSAACALPFVGWLVLLLACIVPGVAQFATGGLSGQVVDPQGAVVGRAKVTVRNLATGITRSMQTAADGSFRADGMDAGDYEVLVSATGFADPGHHVTVRVGQVTSVRAELYVPSGTATVDVMETKHDLDTTSSVLGNPVTQHQILESPLANRSFANIAYLAPGTEPVEPSDPTKARIAAVSSGGSSGQSEREIRAGSADLGADGPLCLGRGGAFRFWPVVRL